MKRHPSLMPFSRDHNAVLILARRLSEPSSASAALDQLRNLWDEEMDDHFREEERLLIPLLPPSLAHRLREEHSVIAGKIAWGLHGNPGLAPELGELLDRHVRWEERELFPYIEARATLAELRSLAQSTDKIEPKRAKTSFAGRRAELLAARPKEDDTPLVRSLAYLARIARDDGPQWGFQSEELNGTLLSFARGQGVSEHVNDELDVLMVAIRGSGVVTVNGERIPLKGAETLMIPKGASRSITATSPQFSYLNIHRRRGGLKLQVAPRRLGAPKRSE